MTEPLKLSEAFYLIAEYAHRQGWIPIGFRSWTVGPWNITVNGTKEAQEILDGGPVLELPPFHALVEHTD